MVVEEQPSLWKSNGGSPLENDFQLLHIISKPPKMTDLPLRILLVRLERA